MWLLSTEPFKELRRMLTVNSQDNHSNFCSVKTPLPKCPHPELCPGLLQGFSRGVQGSPPVGQLRLSPLPALQKQCRPHNVEQGKNDTADILTGL